MSNEQRTKKTRTYKRGPYTPRKGEVNHSDELTLILRRVKRLVEARNTLPKDAMTRKRNEADLLEINKLVGELSGPEHYDIYQEVVR